MPDTFESVDASGAQVPPQALHRSLGHSWFTGGQPLNEEGLPIVDISEPVNENVQANASSPFVLEQDLVPLYSLTPDERTRRRRERDHILDLLEEEERLQQLKEEQDAEEERKESIIKQKESAKAKLEQLKAAQELQRKMGQALVRHVQGRGNNRKEDPKPQTTKKSVAFADAPTEGGHQASAPQPAWGGVIPGRLRAQSRVPLVSTAEEQISPMKMRVMERHHTIPALRSDADSDDESTHSGGPSPSQSENDSSAAEDNLLGNDSLSGDGVEGIDHDHVQHRREIALEYHKKRHVIGAETARLVSTPTLDGCDEQDLVDKQPPLSRFRAARMAAAYDKSQDPVSTSMGQSVTPASRQNTLRKSVRLGRLENGRLVGGESGDSGSEDETVREVIQMLQSGTIQNVGPDFQSPMTIEAPPQSSNATMTQSTSTVARGAKPSKFKTARGTITETVSPRSDTEVTQPRSQSTISNVIERKPPARQHFSANKPTPRSLIKSAPSMIVDSPSFPITSNISSSLAYPTGIDHTEPECWPPFDSAKTTN